MSGSAYAMKGADTLATWRSGWVRKGNVSTLGTLTLPRGAAYTLDAGIGGANAGNGGSFKARQIPAC